MKSTPNIREYASTDYQDVVELMHALQTHFVDVDASGEVRSFTSKEEAKAYIDQGLKDIKEMHGACFVAENNGEVIGFVQGIIDTHEGQVMHNLGHHKSIDGWIGLLFVQPEYRGQGIGRRLIGKMKEYFIENGCKSMRLKVSSGNTNSASFYESLGFKPQEVEMAQSL